MNSELINEITELSCEELLVLYQMILNHKAYLESNILEVQGSEDNNE